MEKPNFISRVGKFFSRLSDLPIQDSVERRMASLLQVILLGFMVVAAIAAILNLIIAPEIPWQAIIVRTLVFLLILFIPLPLLRRGYFRTSAFILIMIFFLLEALAVLSLELNQASGTFSFFTLAIILSGLLVGRYALVSLYLISVGVIVYAAFRPTASDDALGIAFNFILLHGLITLFIDRFGITLRVALNESLARENELKLETIERRKAEEELRNSEARFRSLTENSVAGILISDVQGGILYVNETLLNIFEFSSSEEFTRTNSNELYKDPATRIRLLEELKEKGKVFDFEAEMLTKNGKNITILHSTRLDGDQLFGTLLDITERKKAEKEREDLIAELTAKNAELERFTYTVSHDLKSPLVTIKGFLGYLEQDAIAGNTERLKRDTKRIANAVDKMTELLDDLLELSRIGRFINPAEVIPFDELINQAIELVQGRIIEGNVKLQRQRNLPAVHVDRQRIVEVLQNLLDNAAKNMGDQKEPLIEIGVNGREGDKFIFFVKDNGVGISPAYHESIFKLFNKLEASSEGTGVGLALVKRIIEVHGGRIWVESDAGKGATFYFTLPGRMEESPT